MQDRPIERSPENARQGRIGLNVRTVLHVGIILAIIAFAAIWLFW